MMFQRLCPFALVFLTTSTKTSVISAYDWTCNLFCHNGGVCRHGHGKFGSYAGVEPQDELPFEQEFHDNGMYCTCPVGYTGLQCEIKLITCSRDDHTCFNGSACVKERSSNTGEIFYRCECDVEGSIMDAPYAGKYCEHIATVFCEMGDGFQHGTSYCTNGGKCKKHGDNSNTQHVGCDCPDWWEGDHCEKRIKVISSLTAKVEENLNAGEIIAITFGVILGIALLFYAKRYLFNKRRLRGQEISSKGQKNDTRDII